MPLPRTYVATPKDIVKKWILVDAEDVVLGRLASILAMRSARQAQAGLYPEYGLRRPCDCHQCRKSKADRQ